MSVVGNDKVFGSHWLGILTGTLSWLSGLLNVWALCNYPEYSLDRGGMLVSPPTEGGKQMTPMGSNGGDTQRDTAAQDGAEFGMADDSPREPANADDFGNDNPFA